MTARKTIDPTGSQANARLPIAADELLELRDALAGLLVEIRSQQGRALKPERDASSGVEWGSLFDELRRRVGSLGMVEREPSVDDFGMEADFVARLQPLLDFLYDRYWRVDFTGAESLGSNGPVVFVANRTGRLPWDGMMLSHAVARCSAEIGRPRFLVEDSVLKLPFAQAQFARVGGVRACRENLAALLSRGHSVIAFPEDPRPASRSFDDRYQLGPFGRDSAVRAAIEHQIPLVPVGIVGGEEAYPRLGDVGALARLLSREFGFPALPIPATLPLLGPLGLSPLPSKWVIALGEPVLPHSEGFPGADGDDDGLSVPRLTEQLRAEVERLVEQSLDARPSTWL